MASPTVATPFRWPGTLIVSPTDLTIASPYGGTIIGAFRQGRLLLEKPTHRVTAEEFQETAELVRGGRRVRFRCMHRQWDKDAMLKIFPEATTDADGHALVSDPGNVRAGALGSTNAVKLLVAADAPTTFPSLLIYSAIPTILADGIAFATTEEACPVVDWEGIRDASNRLCQLGFLARMSL